MAQANGSDGKVSVTYSPIRELVVHDVIKSDLKELIRSRMTPQGNMPLYWCGGILFGFTSLPPTKDVIKEYLGGRIHWMEVQYTEMAEYAKEVEANDDQYLKTSVVNTDTNAVHRGFIGWLKGSFRSGTIEISQGGNAPSRKNGKK